MIVGRLAVSPFPHWAILCAPGCLSQVADMRPRMRTTALGGRGQVYSPQQLAFLHCEPVNAQNFCSTPRGPPIKIILHSLPANRTCKQARKSGRLSIIMNSKWKGVVRDCFSWKVHFFPLLKIHRGKHWRLPWVSIFKSILPWARPMRSLKQTEILANLNALLRIGFWSAQDLYPIF